MSDPNASGDRSYVAVVGSSEAAPEELEAAHAVGAALAERGAVLLSGGLGGVMEAACRGAREHGGTTVGILPGADRSAANQYVDLAIATGIGESRNAIVVRAADAVIAVGGEFGTLSEIAFALRAGVPVVGLGTWDLAAAGRVANDPVVKADSASEAVERALELGS